MELTAMELSTDGSFLSVEAFGVRLQLRGLVYQRRLTKKHLLYQDTYGEAITVPDPAGLPEEERREVLNHFEQLYPT
jgi:hypothetical protein